MGGAVQMFHFSDKLFGTVGHFAKDIDRHLNDKKFDFHSMERMFLAVLEVYIWTVLDEASNTVSYGEDAETNCSSLVEAVLAILEESKAYSTDFTSIPNKKGVPTKIDFSYKAFEENPSRNYILQFINIISMYSIYCGAIHHNDGEGMHSLHKLFLPFFAQFSKGYAHATILDIIELRSDMSKRYELYESCELELNDIYHRAAYVSKMQRVVNPSGRSDTSYEADRALEHLNGMFKKMAPAGTSVSDKHSNRMAMVASTIQQNSHAIFDSLGKKTRAKKHSSVSLGKEKDDLFNDVVNGSLLTKDGHSAERYFVKCVGRPQTEHLNSVYIPNLLKLRRARAGFNAGPDDDGDSEENGEEAIEDWSNVQMEEEIYDEEEEIIDLTQTE
ncbi:hypothetical protein HDU98_003344 [Podochytrium sp. JEL0797]|nr:hypothetical protein HDU98_003344 [Podochytrium sp. JEL0797]